LKKTLLLIIILLIQNIIYPKTIISEIEVIGNQKTRSEVILGIARVKVGDEFNEDILKNIKRYLDNQRKFEEVEVKAEKLSEDNVKIIIRVKDKWSIILLPYFAYKNENTSFGLVFIESNLFGYQNSIVISPIYENKKINFFTLFSHPRVKNSLFSYVIGASRLYKDIDIFDMNSVIDNFSQDSYGGFITLKYQFYGEHYIMWSNYNYYYKIVKEPYIEKGKNSFTRLFLKLDWTNYDGYYCEGNYLGLFYEKDLWFSDIKRSITGLKFESFINPYKRQNIYIAFNMFHTFKIDNFFEETIGQDATFYVGPLRGYKKYQIRTETAITNNIEYRIPLAKVFSTDFLVVPFFDSAYWKEKSNNWRLDYSTGISLRFFINKVIIPAMELYFAYGLVYKEYAIGFMIGGRL